MEIGVSGSDIITQCNTARHRSILILSHCSFPSYLDSWWIIKEQRTRPLKNPNNKVIMLLLFSDGLSFSPSHIVAFVLSASCRKMTYCLQMQFGIFFRQSDLLNVANISFGVWLHFTQGILRLMFAKLVVWIMFRAWLHCCSFVSVSRRLSFFPCAWHKRMGPPGSSEMDQCIHVWALQSTGAKVSLNVRSHSITPISSYRVKRKKALYGNQPQSFVCSLTLTPCRNWLPFFFHLPWKRFEVSCLFWICPSWVVLQVTKVTQLLGSAASN